MKPVAVDFLNQQKKNVNVGDLARKLDVSWVTSRQLLMELLLEGYIECDKTSNGWLCRRKTGETNEPVKR